MSRPDHRVARQLIQVAPRKVRTPKSKVVGNAHPEQSAGLVPQKINRLLAIASKGETVV